MAEIDIPHRYLKDNDGELLFPITHIEAVQGFDVENNKASFTDIDDKISQLNTVIEKANATISKMQTQIDSVGKDVTNIAGDTGWVDYTVGNATKNGGISNGYNCMIREVSVGYSNGKAFRFRTVRVNISNIPHNTQVGQLPNGFIDETVRFIPSVSSGHIPPTISIDPAGVMKVYFPETDRDGKQWVYGQHTWLVN